MELLLNQLLLAALLLGTVSANTQWIHFNECPPNEFWANSSSCNPIMYQPPCGNDNCNFRNPGNCVEQCWINKCFCNPGYKRDCRGRCIPADLCSCPCTPCPMNEVWSYCVNAAIFGCPPRSPVRPNVCIGGCICRPGYYRPPNSRDCVPC